MHFQEVILCAAGPSTAVSGLGTISIHDIQTGTSLASLKQTLSNKNCTATVQTRNEQGGFILAAQAEKSILNVYNFQKDQLALKIVLPEKLSCIATDPSGCYCAGGTSQGRVYLWEIASGIMYAAWDAHYRQVTVLRFTHDGAALISGSEDAGVNVWSISRLVDDGMQSELPAPYCSLADHTLPITDVICGIGSFPVCRVLTSSFDHSVKVWDLSSKTLLTTVQFPHPVISLAWDVTERLFFAASDNGSIHQVNLFKQREDKFSRNAMEAIGGAGVTDVIRIDQDEHQHNRKRLISVGMPITAMTISLTSSNLLVGTATGVVQVYDIASHQLLRSISSSSNKGFPISYLSTMLKPPDLVGYVNLTLSASSDFKDAIPVKPIAPFQRTKDPKNREAHEVAMMLPVQATKCHSWLEYSTEELIRDHSEFVRTADSGPNATGASLQSRVIELESEVTRLRENLGKSKSINDTMWETVVQRLIAEGKAKSRGDAGDEDELMVVNDSEDDADRRKRRK